jgi:hypothetical protein
MREEPSPYAGIRATPPQQARNRTLYANVWATPPQQARNREGANARKLH